MKCGVKTKLIISVTLAWIVIGGVMLYLLLKADITGKHENQGNGTLGEIETKFNNSGEY